MNRRSGIVLLWSPRILGILVCLFLGLFSFDTFGGAKTFSLPEFAMHLTPMLILLVAVAASWRWEWVGALVFTGLAAGYTYIARNHISWVIIISGPLLTVGLLFLVSWFKHTELRKNA
jgi:glucose-6-phosphate-specific signal transduction histidine kinase